MNKLTYRIMSLMITLALIFGNYTQTLAAETPSCPNPAYEGFGANTRGGEGQPIYHVTTLSDSGTGSLRSALSSGSRCIVFDIGGVISLSSDLRTQTNVTIDGLSAPSPGITLQNRTLIIENTSGVIVRGLHVRNTSDDGIRVYNSHDVVVDHVSVSGFSDGAVDITQNSYNVTLSWSILGNGIPSHNFPTLINYNADRISVHHNLFSNGNDRNPNCSLNDRSTSNPSSVVNCDVRNNIIWNYHYYGSRNNHAANANIVGNYYYSSYNDPDAIAIQNGARVYTEGNYSVNGYNISNGNVSEPFVVDTPVQTQDAITAAHLVVESAGARGGNFGLDALDNQYVSEVILEGTPAPPTGTTPTPTGPHGSTTVDSPNINIGETPLVTVSLNSVPPEGYTGAEFTCTYDPSILEVSNIVITDLVGPDPAVAINGPQNGSFIIAIAGSYGNKATSSGPVFTFNVKGLQAGQVGIDCKVRVPSGNDQLVDIPSIGTVITVLGVSPTPTATSSSNQPSEPSLTPTPTSSVEDWLTYTNPAYAYQINYPPQSQVYNQFPESMLLNLPTIPGTNLVEKYLVAVVIQNANLCQSPLATSSILNTSETVTINGITFLKQTGGDADAGNYHDWIAYSTSRDNTCVSMGFVLHYTNTGNYDPPRPEFDRAAEATVFEQIVSTYAWLTIMPPDTPIPSQNGILNGQVIASKPATITIYNSDSSTAATVTANADGTFTLTAPAGTYTAVASSSGFLNAQASVTLTDGLTTTLTTINLPAGDIDGNKVIDQFDALTIGINYNTAEPSVADLNNDGIINLLDLKNLAESYRKTGSIVWQ